MPEGFGVLPLPVVPALGWAQPGLSHFLSPTQGGLVRGWGGRSHWSFLFKTGDWYYLGVLTLQGTLLSPPGGFSWSCCAPAAHDLGNHRERCGPEPRHLAHPSLLPRP